MKIVLSTFFGLSPENSAPKVTLNFNGVPTTITLGEGIKTLFE
jgi:hypothetical protein